MYEYIFIDRFLKRKKYYNAINTMHTDTYWILGYKFLRTSTEKYTKII